MKKRGALEEYLSDRNRQIFNNLKTTIKAIRKEQQIISMKNFTIAALAAVTASAEYNSLTIKVDNNDSQKHFKSQSWSTV